MSGSTAYCRAYPASAFLGNPIAESLAKYPVVFLHEDYILTSEPYKDSIRLVDDIDEQWIDYCRDTLGFERALSAGRLSADEAA